LRGAATVSRWLKVPALMVWPATALRFAHGISGRWRAVLATIAIGTGFMTRLIGREAGAGATLG
jgi:hypothetical protein